MQELLSEIETFLDTHAMAATAFGAKAMGDRHLVRQIRAGRRLWPETVAKVRNFMVTYRPERQAA